MCGLFYLRSCAGGTKTGLGNFEFFGIFGNCGGGWSGLSESEKFLDFWEIWGKNEIFWVFWEIWVFWVSKGMEIWTYIILNGKYFQKCIFCFVKSGKYVRRKYFPPTKWDGTTPFGVMGVSVLRVYGLSVATPFYTVSVARYRLRNAATYVERCETR